MICVLCKRDVSKISEHHLIPKSKSKNKKVRKMFSKEHIKKKIGICNLCHNNIHMVLTEKELAFEYNTLEKLREHPDMAKFIKWIENKPDGIKISFSLKNKI